MIEAKPKNLVGDRAYDSDPLDEQLRNDGIEIESNGEEQTVFSWRFSSDACKR